MNGKIRKSTKSNISNGSSHNGDIVKLKKEVGLFGGISLVVGNMIGSGIFLTPAGILAQTGSVGASLCVWTACGVLATLGALCYIELGLMIKQSGGEYQYLRAAFGDVFGFLFVWTNIVVTCPSSAALGLLGVAEYVLTPFYPDCKPPAGLMKCIAAFCLVSITTMNCYSVKLANSVQIMFTIAKLLLIFAIIVGGIINIGQGNIEQFKDPFEGTSASFSTIAFAFYSGLWPYDGWNQLNVVSEEIENHLRNLPLAIIIGIPLVTVSYILVNIGYFSVMTPNDILASNAVAVSFGNRVFASFSFVVPIAIACSSLSATSGHAFTDGRIVYTAARNGHMWQILSFVNVRRCTPSPALIFNCTAALLMLIPDASNFYTLLDYFTFAAWIFRGGTFLSVIVLRFTRPEWERPFNVYLVIPVICFLVSLWLIVAPIFKNPSLYYMYAGMLILAGVIFYVPLVHFKKVPSFINSLTIFFQIILQVVPPPQLKERKKEI